MNRSEFKKLSSVRLREAQILFNQRQYSGSYYLAGYALECALKACICRKMRKGEFPPDSKALKDIYTHNLVHLVRGAELENQLRAQQTSDPVFAIYWALAKDWSEVSRYRLYTREAARDLLQAITDSQHGIMQWLAAHW
jgi:HEPN domain-containing protein